MIVYSCWQDEWSSNVTDEVIFDSNKELTIAKAEQWYNATNPSATTVRSILSSIKICVRLLVVQTTAVPVYGGIQVKTTFNSYSNNNDYL